MKKYPYIKRSFPVQGLINNSREIKKCESELAVKRTEILTLGAQINGFLETLEDSEIKDILILRFIDGLTYKEIPEVLGRRGDGSTEMKRVKAYFNKH